MPFQKYVFPLIGSAHSTWALQTLISRSVQVFWYCYREQQLRKQTLSFECYIWSHLFSSTRFAKKEKASTALSSCVCSTTSKSTWEDSLAIWTRWWKNEDLTVLIFFLSLCSVEPAWLGGLREQECQMYQNMVVWPLSIYYVCRKPFVLAWFHC